MADLFVVGGQPLQIVCAMGFDGGLGRGGSVGTVVGTEVRYNKRTGQTISSREVRTGVSSGTSGSFEADQNLGPFLARNLGVSMDYDLDAVAAAARASGDSYSRDPPLSHARITHVLESRSAWSSEPLWSHDFGRRDQWCGENVRVHRFELSGVGFHVGPTHAFSAVGPGAEALIEPLLAHPIGTDRELLARLSSLGYRTTILPQNTLFQGLGENETSYRRLTLELHKGRSSITLQILDYSGAVQHLNNAAVRVSGNTIVVVGVTPSPVGTAEEIAAEIAAPQRG